MEQVLLESRLDPDALMARIKAGADVRSFLNLMTRAMGGNKFYISPKGGGFKLEKKRWYNNSFAPLFDGKVERNGQGSWITGRFRMNRFVPIFMTFWLGMTGSTGVFILLKGREGTLHGAAKLLLFQPWLMMAFGIALIFVGKWIGSGEEAYILRYLEACSRDQAFEDGA